MSQIQQYTPQQIVGVYTTAADASAKLAEVLDKVHLVSPATSIGRSRGARSTSRWST